MLKLLLAAAILTVLLSCAGCDKTQSGKDGNISYPTFEIVLTDDKGIGEIHATDIMEGHPLYETRSIPVCIKLADNYRIPAGTAHVKCYVGDAEIDATAILIGEPIRLPITMSGDYQVRMEGTSALGTIAQICTIRLK